MVSTHSMFMRADAGSSPDLVHSVSAPISRFIKGVRIFGPLKAHLFEGGHPLLDDPGAQVVCDFFQELQIVIASHPSRQKGHLAKLVPVFCANQTSASRRAERIMR